MPSFNIEIKYDFEAYCADCGAGICNNISTTDGDGRRIAKITIKPCEDCLEASRVEGYEEAEKEKEDD